MAADRPIVKRYPLRYPVESSGDSPLLTEIRWRNPTHGTMRRLGATEIPGDQAALLTNEMTGIPIEILDLMDWADSMIVSKISMDLVEKKSEEAQEIAAEIGIELEIELPKATTRKAEEIAETPPEEVERLAVPAEELANKLRDPLDPVDTL